MQEKSHTPQKDMYIFVYWNKRGGKIIYCTVYTHKRQMQNNNITVSTELGTWNNLSRQRSNIFTVGHAVNCFLVAMFVVATLFWHRRLNFFVFLHFVIVAMLKKLSRAQLVLSAWTSHLRELTRQCAIGEKNVGFENKNLPVTKLIGAKKIWRLSAAIGTNNLKKDTVKKL